MAAAADDGAWIMVTPGINTVPDTLRMREVGNAAPTFVSYSAAAPAHPVRLCRY